MTETQQKTKSITLKGSAELVKEYLLYGVNSILYQRGIYPPETFQPTEQFGLFILMSTDEKIKAFLDVVLGQIQEWLVQRKVRKVTLVITNVNTKEVLEKWDFIVSYEGQVSNGTNDNTKNELPEVGNKDIKSIQKEIREVIRQITGTVSFLPLLDCLCSFDVLTYTVPDCNIPNEWDETQPAFIANSQEEGLEPPVIFFIFLPSLLLCLLCINILFLLLTLSLKIDLIAGTVIKVHLFTVMAWLKPAESYI